MRKLKKMLNTKGQHKYIGPQTVERVTESHVTIYITRSAREKEKHLFQSRLLALTLTGI